MTDTAPSPYTFIRTASREEIESAKIAVCVLDRAEIERHMIGSAIDRLMILTDEDETCRQLESKVTLIVEGYENDPRELYEIPECIAFVRALNDEWPQWYHFLDRSGDEPGLLLWLLLDPTGVRHTEQGPVLRFDASEVRSMHDRLLRALERMHERLGYGVDVREGARRDIEKSLRASGFTLTG